MSSTEQFNLKSLKDLINSWEDEMDKIIKQIPLFPKEVINEFWFLNWVSKPSSKEDKWKSDWVRILLIAFSNKQSEPAKFKANGGFKRTFKDPNSSMKKEIEEPNSLSVYDEWNHLSPNSLYKVLSQFEHLSLIIQDYSILLKWLEFPTKHTSIKIDLYGDYKLDPNILVKIQNSIPKNIKNLDLDFGYDQKIILPSDFLSNLSELNEFKIRIELKKEGIFDFTDNIAIQIINISCNDHLFEIKCIENCKKIKSFTVLTDNQIKLDKTNWENFFELNTLNIGPVLYSDNIIAKIKGNNFSIGSEENNSTIIDSIDIKLEYNKETDDGFNTNKVAIQNIEELKHIKAQGFISNIEIKEVPDLKSFNINSTCEIRDINLIDIPKIVEKSEIVGKSISNLTIEKYQNELLPIFKTFSNADETQIILENNLLTSIEGLEGIKNISEIKIINDKSLKNFKHTNNLNFIFVNSLSIENSDFDSLEGIKQFPNIKKLELIGLSKIISLDGIEDLIELEYLDLSKSKKIIDLSPLLKLKKLKEIKVSGCDGLKPKPKKNILSGVDLILELKKVDNNVLKPEKQKEDSISKSIKLMQSLDSSDINKGILLLSECSKEEIAKLIEGVSYVEKDEKIILPNLPIKINKSKEKGNSIILKILSIVPKDLLQSKTFNKIKSISNSGEGNLQIKDFKFFSEIFKGFEGLQFLINLERLDISECENINIKNIQVFENLKFIKLNRVGQIEGWSDLLKSKNLQYIEYYDAIEETIDFKDLIAPVISIVINGNFCKIDNLGNLKKLKELEIASEKEFATINITGPLPSLNSMSLTGMFKSINGFENATNISELALYFDTKITDTKFLIELMSKHGFKSLEDGVYMK